MRGTIGAGATGSLAPYYSGLAVSLNSVIPMSGTIRRLYLGTATAQPGSGSLVAEVKINGAATGVKITLAAGAAGGTYSDLVNQIHYTAGDSLRVDLVNNAAAASAQIGFLAFEFLPD